MRGRPEQELYSERDDSEAIDLLLIRAGVLLGARRRRGRRDRQPRREERGLGAGPLQEHGKAAYAIDFRNGQGQKYCVH